jgi:DNA helicase HerA-like ATPase
MDDANGLFVGSASGTPLYLNLKRANRHGLIAGATGTGKTVTLQGIAEGFSNAGVPVFLADVKGDLAGIAMPGSPLSKSHAILTARAAEIGLTDYAYAAAPAQLWDLFGEAGDPVRTTISEMGPLLLSRLMGLTEVQEGVLAITFKAADDQGLLLLDLGDLRAMLGWVADNADDLTTKYGNVAKSSVGAIQRALLQLEGQGADRFFGEPALDIRDLIRTDDAGKGIVSVLAADKLMAAPKLYASFLLWLLSELFEVLPEIGDPDKPVIAFFFDEAHLLFDDAPPALLDRIEQVVRLIRSKGVSVWFVTQNPIDVPDAVAGQLGNRIQHALRAFTPRDQKAVKAAAETFRANPNVDVATAITELKVGEALVSLLQADGSPAPVERTLIRPPASRLGPLTDTERRVLRASSAIAGKYDTAIDRESAEELLAARATSAAAEVEAGKARAIADKAAAEEAKLREKSAAEAAKLRDKAAAEEAKRAAREAARPSLSDRVIESATKSVASSIGRQLGGRLGGQIVRGILGGLFRGR